ncbi:MAG: chemotaxis protein CheV [Candidatus Anammoxibacter sp.]
MAKQEILLESGTNEVEIAEFVIGSQNFGVNVAKIREFVPFDQLDITKIPDKHPSMLGVFLLRNNTIPLIDLEIHLNIKKKERVERRVVAVTDFNNTVNGFVIDSITRIHRLSWKDIQPMTGFLENCATSITGTIHIEDREILVLDAEQIIDDIFPEYSMASKENTCVEASLLEKRKQKKLIIAEDSSTIRNLIIRMLSSVGYSNVTAYENGKDAYDAFVVLKDKIENKGESITDLVNLAVFDIEMPQMDGLTLCKKVKTDLGLPNIPVIMFSSLINKQMEIKCKKMGADAHITKPQINELVELVDKFCLNEE